MIYIYITEFGTEIQSSSDQGLCSFPFVSLEKHKIMIHLSHVQFNSLVN